jgi:D-alanyl-D-alanine carboxypeptidase
MTSSKRGKQKRSASKQVRIIKKTSHPVTGRQKKKVVPGSNLLFDPVVAREAAVARLVIKLKEKFPLPYVSASCWAVYDAKSTNGNLQLVKGSRETERREVASMTKMMTFYTSYQIFKKNCTNLPKGPLYQSMMPFWMEDEPKERQKTTIRSSESNQLLGEYSNDSDFKKANELHMVVSGEASQIIGTTAKLEEGDVLSYLQLLYGMMLPSGNDAAYTVAEYFSNVIFEAKYKKMPAKS